MLSACGFESLQAHHVGAKSAPFMIPTQTGGDFSCCSLAPPFRPRFASLDSRPGLDSGSKVSTPAISRSNARGWFLFRIENADGEWDGHNPFDRADSIALLPLPVGISRQFGKIHTDAPLPEANFVILRSNSIGRKNHSSRV